MDWSGRSGDLGASPGTLPLPGHRGDSQGWLGYRRRTRHGVTAQHSLEESKVLVQAGNPAMCGTVCRGNCYLMGVCPGGGLQGLLIWGHL